MLRLHSSVNPGSVLTLQSQVVYTTSSALGCEEAESSPEASVGAGPGGGFPLVQVRVQANVGNFSAAFAASNVFHFNFKCASNQRRVIPNAYSGTTRRSIWWLDALV
jgi:hypothetical protein